MRITRGQIERRPGELLEYLAEHKRRYGYTPTVMQIGDHFARSNRWVMTGLIELQRGGMIVRGDRRGIITITTTGWDALRVRMGGSS